VDRTHRATGNRGSIGSSREQPEEHGRRPDAHDGLDRYFWDLLPPDCSAWMAAMDRPIIPPLLVRPRDAGLATAGDDGLGRGRRLLADRVGLHCVTGLGDRQSRARPETSRPNGPA